jgi:segregation and condensation protein A
VAEAGARLAIRLLQDAAERGELDPWDVDVIAVVDGFLDQLRSRIEVPRLVAVAAGAAGQGGSYEQDLAETSEAFLAASVLVGLKAEVLEAQTFPPAPLEEAFTDLDLEDQDSAWQLAPGIALPRRPERHLQRRPVAPPPLQRPVTLGELIRQLEEIAERLEQDDGTARQRSRSRRYSERAVIEQVAALAHREKLPETTAALSQFLLEWPKAAQWCSFEALVSDWAAVAPADLDCDRVGVFWALLFLCSQGRVELEQAGGLFAPLHLKLLLPEPSSSPLTMTAGAATAAGSAGGPAGQAQAA